MSPAPAENVPLAATALLSLSQPTPLQRTWGSLFRIMCRTTPSSAHIEGECHHPLQAVTDAVLSLGSAATPGWAGRVAVTPPGMGPSLLGRVPSPPSSEWPQSPTEGHQLPGPVAGGANTPGEFWRGQQPP